MSTWLSTQTTIKVRDGFRARQLVDNLRAVLAEEPDADEDEAQVRINIPDPGVLEVTLGINNNFSYSTAAAVREALEAFGAVTIEVTRVADFDHDANSDASWYIGSPEQLAGVPLLEIADRLGKLDAAELEKLSKLIAQRRAALPTPATSG